VQIGDYLPLRTSRLLNEPFRLFSVMPLKRGASGRVGPQWEEEWRFGDATPASIHLCMSG